MLAGGGGGGKTNNSWDVDSIPMCQVFKFHVSFQSNFVLGSSSSLATAKTDLSS